MSDLFDDVAFPAVVEVEGAYSCDPNDPGNWTGGECDVGILKGTKWGISAAAFPTLDIEHLSVDVAKAIARALYWTPIHADHLPPALAVAAFDCAYNQGVGAAVELLQRSAGVAEDGIMGPITLRALTSTSPRALFIEFTAQRVLRYVQLSRFRIFGLGWMRRVATITYTALVPA